MPIYPSCLYVVRVKYVRCDALRALNLHFSCLRKQTERLLRERITDLEQAVAERTSTIGSLKSDTRPLHITELHHQLTDAVYEVRCDWAVS